MTTTANEPEQCSEAFFDAFDSGTAYNLIDCQCGMVHFNETETASAFEPGQLAAMVQRSQLQPPTAQPHRGAVNGMSIGGKFIALGCKCEFAGRYEQFIVTHQTRIAQYLRSLAERLRASADEVDPLVPKYTITDGLMMNVLRAVLPQVDDARLASAVAKANAIWGEWEMNAYAEMVRLRKEFEL